MPRSLLKITASEIDRLPRDQTAFIFSVGPIEDHGPHLPLGLDLQEAEKLSWMAAEKLEQELPGWSVVLMPPAPLGVDSNTSALAVTVRPYVLRDWLVDASRSLMRLGFRNFICFTGNLGPRQLTAIEDAGKLIEFIAKFKGPRKVRFLSANSVQVERKKVMASPFRLDPVEHGGLRDTSVALYFEAKLVSESYLHLLPIEREASVWKRNWLWRRKQLSGYWGAPEHASEAEGRRIIGESLEEIVPRLTSVLQDGGSSRLFRSWYAVFPPNKSFFKAWMLSILILIVLVSWAMTVIEVLPGE